MTEPYQAGPGEDPVPQRALEPYADPAPQRAQDPYLPPTPQRAQERYLPPAPFPAPAGDFAPAPHQAPDAHLDAPYQAPPAHLDAPYQAPAAPMDALYRAPQEPLAPAQPPAAEAPPADLYRAPEQQLAPAQPPVAQDQLAALYRAPEQRLAPAPDQSPVQRLAPAPDQAPLQHLASASHEAALEEATDARRVEPVVADPDVTSFRGAIGWTIAGTILPGLGFLKARRWFEGIFTLLCFLLLVGGVGYLVYQRTFIVRLTTSPITLLGIAVLCGMMAILITGIILATYYALRPHVVTAGQRIGGAVLVLVLSFLVCLPLAVGAGYTLSQAGLVR